MKDQGKLEGLEKQVSQVQNPQHLRETTKKTMPVSGVTNTKLSAIKIHFTLQIHDKMFLDTCSSII